MAHSGPTLTGLARGRSPGTCHCTVYDNEAEWFSIGPEVVLCVIRGEPMDWAGVRGR